MATTPKVSLKLLIDTKKKRVLFAEASKDFIDFLFNLLALPIGTVIKLLTKENMVGCLGSLYDSVENLNETYMQSTQNIDSVLNPKVQNDFPMNFPLLLKQDVHVSANPKYYRCRGSSCNYVSTVLNTGCPNCATCMSRECSLVPGLNVATTETSATSKVGYVKGVVAYMVMDDLVVKPMSTISSITMLNKFNIKEVGALEEKEVELTMTEGVKLLKASLQSKMVLTDVFLGNSAA